MELKSISEIKNLSTTELESYAVDLSLLGQARPIIDSQIACIINTPNEQIPASIRIIGRLLELFKLQWENDTSHISIDPNIVSVEDSHFVSWEIHGITHSIIVNSYQRSQIIHARDLAYDYDNSSFDNLIETYFQEPSAPMTAEERNYLISLDLLEDYTIPTNSKSLSVKENTARFSGALWYDAIQQKVITLAGLGGIGSYVSFLLARMNPTSLFIYDNDKVEAVNMSGQLYSKSDIGMYKVEAMSKMVSNYADYNSVFAISQRFTEESEASDIMICGFDNMIAREIFFEKWASLVNHKNEEDRCHCLFIDGRLSAEELQVYCITGDNSFGINEYRDSLFTDEEADETVCSYKQTTYMANMIGSIIVNLFTNFVANETLGFLGRELPFFTSYSGITMQFKIR